MSPKNGSRGFPSLIPFSLSFFADALNTAQQHDRVMKRLNYPTADAAGQKRRESKEQ